MQRLKLLATKRGMAKAARVQARRRGLVGPAHRYVIGRLQLEADGRVVLWAVPCGPAYEIQRPPVLTNDLARFNRWATRQAADQFKRRWHLDVHVLNLDFLDVHSATHSDPR